MERFGWLGMPLYSTPIQIRIIIAIIITPKSKAVWCCQNIVYSIQVIPLLFPFRNTTVPRLSRFPTRSFPPSPASLPPLDQNCHLKRSFGCGLSTARCSNALQFFPQMQVNIHKVSHHYCNFYHYHWVSLEQERSELRRGVCWRSLCTVQHIMWDNWSRKNLK